MKRGALQPASTGARLGAAARGAQLRGALRAGARRASGRAGGPRCEAAWRWSVFRAPGRSGSPCRGLMRQVTSRWNRLPRLHRADLESLPEPDPEERRWRREAVARRPAVTKVTAMVNRIQAPGEAAWCKSTARPGQEVPARRRRAHHRPRQQERDRGRPGQRLAQARAGGRPRRQVLRLGSRLHQRHLPERRRGAAARRRCATATSSRSADRSSSSSPAATSSSCTTKRSTGWPSSMASPRSTTSATCWSSSSARWRAATATARALA